MSKRTSLVAAAVVASLGLTAGAAVALQWLGPEQPDASSAFGAPAPSKESGDPVQYAPAAGSPLALDRSPVVGSVLSRLDSKGVLNVHSALGPEGALIRVNLAAFDETVGQVWLAGLAAGAEAEIRSGGRGVYSQVVDRVEVAGPDASRAVELGKGAVAMGQVFNSPSDDALSTRVEAAARRFGLAVERHEILRPLESALSVTLAVPDGLTPSWTIDELRAALAGAPVDVEGLLIRLVDPRGRLLVEAGTAYRTGEGGLWFAPGQDQRFGAVHGSVGPASP